MKLHKFQTANFYQNSRLLETEIYSLYLQLYHENIFNSSSEISLASPAYKMINKFLLRIFLYEYHKFITNVREAIN